MRLKSTLLLICLAASATMLTLAQNVNVDINFNIKHSVGSISDFGRERHITLHSSIGEPDWNNEQDKMEYLINDLDAYFGRDNGSASWKFSSTWRDSTITTYPDSFYPDMGHMADFGAWSNEQYENMEDWRLQFEPKAQQMICGTNPHPTYPTLSWGDNCGKEGDYWRPMFVETSADWVTQYLDKFFVDDASQAGEPRPYYWEVVNEIDMVYMTGQQVHTKLEDVFKYHNLVANQVRERLGNRAPKIGGMTWGLHDLYKSDGLSRWDCNPASHWEAAPYNYDPITAQIWAEACNTQYTNRSDDWFQWDAQWKGFIDNCGENMDFYSIHLYDWPTWPDGGDGYTRTGGQVEATLEMVEWYQNYKFGTQKPIVISEYGAIVDQSKDMDEKFEDWANLKTFSAMLMQFLERPHLIEKTMPFAPVKATWGDYRDANGNTTNRYPITMMNTDSPNTNDENAVWYWREIIKWYELWSEVKGTRIDTKAHDLDVQVDCYIDGKYAYLILNSLDNTPLNLNLNYFEDYNNPIISVSTKHLFLNTSLGTNGQPELATSTLNSVPANVVLQPHATMILKYEFQNNVNIDQTSVETKYFGESLSGGTEPHRITNGAMTAHVNNVVIPQNGEAMLRITGAFIKDWVFSLDSRNKISINDYEFELDMDWRGYGTNNIWFGVLELEIPMEHLKTNNTIVCDMVVDGDYTNANIVVWDFSKVPGRSDGIVCNQPVTAVSISPANISLGSVGETATVSSTVSPPDACNKAISYSSSNTSIATINSSGIVTAVANGNAIITVTTSDGGFTATTSVNVDISTDEQSPYPSGIAHEIPGTIEAEDFDNGGEGTAYHDNDAANSGNSYRINEGVDIENCSEGGYNVGWTSTGEWLEYSVNIMNAGNHEMEIRYASNGSTGGIQIEFNGVDKTGNIELPTTGGWQSWQTVTKTVTLDAGEYIMRVYINSAGINLNYITFSSSAIPVDVTGVSVNPTSLSFSEAQATSNITQTVSPPDATDKSVSWSSSNSNVATVNQDGLVTAIANGQASITVTTSDGGYTASTSVEVNIQTSTQTAYPDGLPHSVPGKIESEDYDIGGQDIAYNEATDGNSGNQYRTDESVDVQTCGEGGYNVGWTAVGEWLEYTVDIAKSGNYNIEVRYASNSADGDISIEFNGINKTGTVNLPTTGGWQTYNTVSANVNLEQGVQVMRVNIINAGINLNYISIEEDVDIISPLVIQAEDFVETGGAYGGFQVYDVNGVTAINWNQTGDWGDYSVDVPQDGSYRVEYYIGTPMTNSAVEFFVNGNSIMKDFVPANGNWDEFVSLVAASEVNLEQGNQTIRLMGAGTVNWEWNMDRFELKRMSDIKAAQPEFVDVLTGISVYPNPAKDYIIIGGLSNGSYDISIYNLQGVKLITHETNVAMNSLIKTDELPYGYYIITIKGNNSVKTIRFSKK